MLKNSWHKIVYFQPPLDAPGLFGPIRTVYDRLTDKKGFCVLSSRRPIEAIYFSPVASRECEYTLRSIHESAASVDPCDPPSPDLALRVEIGDEAICHGLLNRNNTSSDEAT
jgi:hypothetical protein